MRTETTLHHCLGATGAQNSDVKCNTLNLGDHESAVQIKAKWEIESLPRAQGVSMAVGACHTGYEAPDLSL
jgi:hypothetical protein